jgi:hypothetical protein
MPKSHRMEFFFSQKSDKHRLYYSHSSDSKKSQVTTWIDRLSGELLQPSKSEAAQESLKQICEMVTSRMQTFISGPTPAHSFERKYPPFSDEDIFRVIKTCVDVDMKDLFLAAYEICPEKLTPFMFQSVGLALLRYDLESLLDK